MTTNKKICTACKIEKSIVDFYYQATTKDRLTYRCKSCASSRLKSSSILLSDSIEITVYTEAEILKIHEDRQVEKRKKAKEKYNENITAYRNTRRIQMSIRLKQDPLFKLRHNIRNLIRNSVNGAGFSKKTKTYKILGCSFDDFKKHIENQFSPGMLWENYGQWEYDHMTPVSWATTETEIIALNHYTNFQPLWKEQNRNKSNKFSDSTL
jgi:hypothetical protein